MSKHGTIRRYSLLMEEIGKLRYPSFRGLREYLHEHGFEVSARTIQRDIEQIRFEFGIEIKYDRYKDGYYIDKETSINLDSFLRFLEIVSTADLLTESLRDSKDALNYLSFESQANLKGIENLKSLLQAVKIHREISFIHENFTTGKKKKYSLKPYMLKEYQNRWYVVGIIVGVNHFMSFGIDRIEKLVISSKTFSPDPNLNPLQVFESIVGLSGSQDSVETVILSFTPLQGKYVKTLPLHKSQEILHDDENEVRISLKLVPNFEFKQRILMLGEAVKVLEPEWLANDITSVLRTSLDNYK